MRLNIKHPESVIDVFFLGILEGLVLSGNYVFNGPGPAPVAVIVIAIAITAWIIRADYRIIKRDGLYPWADPDSNSDGRLTSVYGDLEPNEGGNRNGAGNRKPRRDR